MIFRFCPSFEGAREGGREREGVAESLLWSWCTHPHPSTHFAPSSRLVAWFAYTSPPAAKGATIAPFPWASALACQIRQSRPPSMSSNHHRRHQAYLCCTAFESVCNPPFGWGSSTRETHPSIGRLSLCDATSACRLGAEPLQRRASPMQSLHLQRRAQNRLPRRSQSQWTLRVHSQDSQLALLARVRATVRIVHCSVPQRKASCPSNRPCRRPSQS